MLSKYLLRKKILCSERIFIDIISRNMTEPLASVVINTVFCDYSILGDWETKA